KLTERRMTLGTGEVPFWQALDQLCRTAGLTEDQGVSSQRLAAELRVLRNRPANGLPPPDPVPPLPAYAATKNPRNYMATPTDHRPVQVFAPSGETGRSGAIAVTLEDGELAAPPPCVAGAVRVGVGDRALTVAAEPKIPAVAVMNLRID